MSGISLQDALTLATVQLNQQCFRRWHEGGSMRLGATLREHCLNYFRPVELAKEFLEQARRANPVAVALVGPVYEAAVQASRMVFEGYDDAQTEEAYNQWKRGEGY